MTNLVVIGNLCPSDRRVAATFAAETPATADTDSRSFYPRRFRKLRFYPLEPAETACTCWSPLRTGQLIVKRPTRYISK
jgi:hypothetical protein